VTGRVAIAAAVAAAVAALPARADRLDDAEAELARLDGRLAAASAAAAASEDGAAARAARGFELGEARLRVGDLDGAVTALQLALDEPGFRAGPELAPALHELADALRRQGRDEAALQRYRELLRLPGAAAGRLGREALPRAMDCALRLARPAEAAALLDLARGAGAGAAEPLPPEALYLAAKAALRRADLPPPARLEAIAAVPPPYHLHAAYLEGVARIEAGALGAAEAAFGRCAAAEARGPAQHDVRELCVLALARLAADGGRFDDADRHYRALPRRSPRHPEALQEHAAAAVRAGRTAEAARLVASLPELPPESPLAPRAALLHGELLLRVGHADEAVARFERVVEAYAPLRDELDRALATAAEPARWYAALAGPGPGRAEPPRLPRLALRWAREHEDAPQVLAVAAALAGAEAELAAARRHAVRVEGVLARNYGLGAFAALEDGYARAEAVENGALRLVGALAAFESELLAPRPGPALAAARAERRAAEERLAPLPSSAEAMADRRRDVRARLAALRRELVEVRAALAAGASVADDVEIALSARPGALAADRAGLAAELAAARRALAGDVAEVDRLAERAVRLADGAPLAGRADEDALRAAYRTAVERELELAHQATASASALPPLVARADRLRARAIGLEAAADRAKREILREARARAAVMRQVLAAERALVAAEEARLAPLRAEAERTIGAAAERVFRSVRAQLHAAVLRADVGVIDASWSEKQRSLAAVRAAASGAAAAPAGAAGSAGGSGGRTR
jgi:hypothetical protein